jgi:hypothetical protein
VPDNMSTSRVSSWWEYDDVKYKLDLVSRKWCYENYKKLMEQLRDNLDVGIKDDKLPWESLDLVGFFFRRVTEEPYPLHRRHSHFAMIIGKPFVYRMILHLLRPGTSRHGHILEISSLPFDQMKRAISGFFEMDTYIPYLHPVFIPFEEEKFSARTLENLWTLVLRQTYDTYLKPWQLEIESEEGDPFYGVSKLTRYHFYRELHEITQKVFKYTDSTPRQVATLLITWIADIKQQKRMASLARELGDEVAAMDCENKIIHDYIHVPDREFDRAFMLPINFFADRIYVKYQAPILRKIWEKRNPAKPRSQIERLPEDAKNSILNYYGTLSRDGPKKDEYAEEEERQAFAEMGLEVLWADLMSQNWS